MDSDFVEWMYLKEIVGNFDQLITYYFGAMAHFAPWFRQAAVGILYSLGMAWAAFCFLKAPVDRLKAGLGVFGMVLLSGFLVSPTTNTRNLGGNNGVELSVGGYYSFLLAGSISQVFTDVVAASWSGSVRQAVKGSAGMDAVAIAFNDKSQQFADEYLKSEGKDAYLDYMQQCGTQALTAAITPKQKSLLKNIGITANTLGMAPETATTVNQYIENTANGNTDYGVGVTLSADGGTYLLEAAAAEAKSMEANRREAETMLKELASRNNKIDGTKGYRIPTTEFYKTALGDTPATSTSDSNFKKVSQSDSDYAAMLPNGAQSTTPGAEEDYVFYPKNCYDMYLVARETMSNFRKGVQGVKGYENLDLTGQVTSLSAANKVRRGLNDLINKQIAEAGGDQKVAASLVETASDNAKALFDEIGNEFNKFMLEFKIPFMISSMALLVAILLITFPIFAVISIVFGPKVLISYFKFMALPFLVVFVNNLLLSISADLISFNKGVQAYGDTFHPGGVDLPASLSQMNTESIIYGVICICELAIAKFILWDDVKAVTSFNMSAAATAATERGASLLSTVASLIAMPITRGAKIASSTKAAQAQSVTNNAISSIAQSVSNIANGGSKAMKSGGSNQSKNNGAAGTFTTPPPPGGSGGGGGTGGGGNRLTPP